MEHKFVQTTCPHCGCGCRILLEVLDGRIIGTSPLKTAEMNGGKLCIKGWNAHEWVHSSERLTQPLVRKNGSFKEVSWSEALDMIVSRLSGIRAQHGPDSIGFLSSARATNEDNYLVQQLCRAGIGTNNVDHCARL